MVISGDIGMPNCRDTDTLMTEAEVAAVAETVHAHGRRMNAHACSAQSVKMCVRHGIDIIYHANFADEKALDMLEANEEQLFVSPNIGFPVVAVHEGKAWGLEPEEVIELGFPEELEGACENMKKLYKRASGFWAAAITASPPYPMAITPEISSTSSSSWTSRRWKR